MGRAHACSVLVGWCAMHVPVSFPFFSPGRGRRYLCDEAIPGWRGRWEFEDILFMYGESVEDFTLRLTYVVADLVLKYTFCSYHM